MSLKEVLGLENNILLNSHPFFSGLSCRSEVKTELVQQVLLFIVHNKSMGLDEVCGFLKPFLSFSILRIPFSDSGSSASFARELVSSVTILCCTFSCEEGLPLLKLVMQCLKYFSCKDSRDLEDILYVAEYLVDAFIVVLKQCVEAGVMLIKSQLRGVELLGTLLSFYIDLDKHFGRKETIVELSKRLLLVQKELDLQCIPELSSLPTSMFLILTRTDFEYEQLSIMKISFFLFKWRASRIRERNILRTDMAGPRLHRRRLELKNKFDKESFRIGLRQGRKLWNRITGIKSFGSYAGIFG